MVAEALLCLALNLYHEARNQSFAGMIAVANVVMNRVNSEDYPDTVCGVVKQGPVRESWETKKDPTLKEHERIYYPVKNMCQFSWYCDGIKDEAYNVEMLERAKSIAALILSGAINDITEGSTHYHADYVNPDWASRLKRTVKIDNHIFYRPR